MKPYIVVSLNCFQKKYESLQTLFDAIFDVLSRESVLCVNRIALRPSRVHANNSALRMSMCKITISSCEKSMQAEYPTVIKLVALTA